MKERFCRPFTSWQLNRPLIVYPVNGKHGLKEVLPKLGVEDGENLLQSYLEDLYLTNHAMLKTGTYHIVFLSSNGEEPMTNVWAYGTNPDTEAGPRLLRVLPFRNLGLQQDAPDGLGNRDMSVVIGAEAWLHMSVPNYEYHDRHLHMPTFPSGFISDQRFGEDEPA